MNTTVNAEQNVQQESSVLGFADILALMGKSEPKIVSTRGEMSEGDYIVGPKGLHQLIENPLGKFVPLTNKFAKEIPFVSIDETPVYTGLKIPGKYFYGVLRFYARMYNSIKSEVMAEFFYNKVTGEWRVVVPEQVVSGASITYQQNDECYTNPDWFKVSTSHSHHTMAAFFSAVDSADEKKLNCQYAFVIGGMKFGPNQELTNFSTVQRIAIGGSFVDVKLEDIFDFSEEGHVTAWDIDPSNDAKITQRAAVTYPAQGYYGGYGANKNTSHHTKKTTPTVYGSYYGGDWHDRYYGDGYNAGSPVMDGKRSPYEYDPDEHKGNSKQSKYDEAEKEYWRNVEKYGTAEWPIIEYGGSVEFGSAADYEKNVVLNVSDVGLHNNLFASQDLSGHNEQYKAERDLNPIGEELSAAISKVAFAISGNNTGRADVAGILWRDYEDAKALLKIACTLNTVNSDTNVFELMIISGLLAKANFQVDYNPMEVLSGVVNSIGGSVE